MNKAKFTKGPWVFKDGPDEFHRYSEGGFYNNDGDLIMDFGDDEPHNCSYGKVPNDYDANLITAAPEMYDLLAKIEAGNGRPNCEEILELLTKARGEK